MSKKIFKYAVVLTLLLSYINVNAWGKEAAGTVDDFDASLAGMKNPFSSPLVVQKKPVEVEKKKELPPPKPVEAPKPVEVVVKQAVNPPSIKISGLVWNSSKPQAILNGKIVAVGEEVEGARLVAVQKSGVEVMFKEQLFTILSNQPDVKVNAKKSK